MFYEQINCVNILISYTYRIKEAPRLMDLKINSFLEEIECLLEKCEKQFAHIDGSVKLKRKLEAEKKFLNSVNLPSLIKLDPKQKTKKMHLLKAKGS